MNTNRRQAARTAAALRRHMYVPTMSSLNPKLKHVCYCGQGYATERQVQDHVASMQRKARDAYRTH